MVHEVDARAASGAIVEGRVALLHEARNLGLLVDAEPESPRPENVERDRLAEERKRNDVVQEEDKVLVLGSTSDGSGERAYEIVSTRKLSR